MWLIEDNVANVEIRFNGWSIEDVIKIYIAICSIEDNVEIHIPGVPKKFPSKFISKWTKIRTDEGGVQNGIKKFDFVFWTPPLGGEAPHQAK